MIIASIDVGSNTVLLLIAEVNLQTKKLITLLDEQRLPRISEGLKPGKKISSKAEIRLFSVLKEYFAIIRKYNCDTILLSGTNTFRIASNSEEIKNKIRNYFNSNLKIVTGKEEAELAFLGINEYGIDNEKKLVIDIGGGSTEIIYGNEQILFSHSFNFGVVSISEKYINKNKPILSNLHLLNGFLKENFIVLPELTTPSKAIAIAGTPVTLACLNKELNIYSESEVEGSVLNQTDIEILFHHLKNLSPKEILKLYPKIIKGREDLILSGTSILLYIMKLLDIEKVIVSTKGIRYGAVIKYIDEVNQK